jgi:hypothetical protein
MHEAVNFSQYYVYVNNEHTSFRLVKTVHSELAIGQAILDIFTLIRRRWNCEVVVIRTDSDSVIQEGTNFEAELTAEGYHVALFPLYIYAHLFRSSYGPECNPLSGEKRSTS